MARHYQFISSDSHLDLSPERWRDRVPAEWRDRAPKRVTMENGEDAVVIEDREPMRIGYTRSVGVSHDQLHLQVPTFENSAGTGDSEQRLREQDEDGVDAEVLFSRVGHLRAIKEDEGYLAMNHAYNEYLAEEYCAAAPNRLFALGVIPTTGVEDAVAELEYCVTAGLKGVLLDRFPNGSGCPTAEDDRFWSAALDLQMPITSHTAGGCTRFRDKGPSFLFPHRPESDRGEPFGQMFRFCSDAPFAPIQMAFAGVWDRFPNLKIYWAETQIGWLSYTLWQIDDHVDRYGHLWNSLWGLELLKRPASEYIREHCLWGFLDDPIGVANRDAAGIDNLLWGSDFAHAASDWPHSREVIEKNFVDVPKEERDRMVAGNAIRFFHLENP